MILFVTIIAVQIMLSHWIQNYITTLATIYKENDTNKHNIKFDAKDAQQCNTIIKIAETQLHNPNNLWNWTFQRQR